MRQRLRAMRAGWVLLIVTAVLAVLDVPYAVAGLIGTAILAFVLTIRFIAARDQSRARYGDGSASSDTTHSTWISDAFGWTALSAAYDTHHHHDSGDYDRKPQADSSDSSGGFFSFFSDSGSSDSGSSGSDYSGSDGGSSDSGSSDSGSSSSSSD